jgi:hypothetical protein
METDPVLKCRFLDFNSRWWIKSRTPVILNVIHRQNLLDPHLWMFEGNVVSLSLVLKSKPNINKKQIMVLCFLCLLSDPADGISTLPSQNGELLSDYIMLHSRRQYSSNTSKFVNKRKIFQCWQTHFKSLKVVHTFAYATWHSVSSYSCVFKDISQIAVY